VSAPTKRRHLSYYFSLPVVVAIVFFLVARLATWQRAEIVAELADRVAHQEAQEATLALRQLAGMPRPPIDVLVSAAASPDQEIAKEAQLLISGLLRRWSREIDTDRRVRIVTRRLAELAQALSKQQANFSSADHPWLSGTARKILRLANRLSPQDSPLVATHCDSVLASIAESETAITALVDRDLSLTRQPVVTRVAAPAQMLDEEPTRAVLEPEAGAYVGPTSGASSRNALREPAATMREEHSAAPLQTERSQLSADDDPFAGEVTGEPSHDMTPAAAFQSPWRGAWSHPMFRMLPAMPINDRSADGGKASSRLPSVTVTEQDAAQSDMPGLAGADSRQLLEQWLTASGGEVLPLEEELTRRGFGRLSARLVQQLFSADAEERLRLVDDVLTEPGVDARPWLILLADDSFADVRLLAVTIMATSNDALLIEKAWQVAISDRDPRIAGLAGRLRERRDGLQRR
jgi:hypothetical protein